MTNTAAFRHTALLVSLAFAGANLGAAPSFAAEQETVTRTSPCGENSTANSTATIGHASHQQGQAAPPPPPAPGAPHANLNSSAPGTAPCGSEATR